MAPYSMDLRTRVATAKDRGLSSDAVAAQYEVSRAWVDRLMQRRRETGSLAPKAQTKFRGRRLAGEEDRLRALIEAQPDVTLVELRVALSTTASVATIARAVIALGFSVKKNRTRRRTTAP
jgi:transposase